MVKVHFCTAAIEYISHRVVENISQESPLQRRSQSALVEHLNQLLSEPMELSYKTYDALHRGHALPYFLVDDSISSREQDRKMSQAFNDRLVRPTPEMARFLDCLDVLIGASSISEPSGLTAMVFPACKTAEGSRSKSTLPSFNWLSEPTARNNHSTVSLLSIDSTTLATITHDQAYPIIDAALCQCQPDNHEINGLMRQSTAVTV